jgi:uncharacterized protein YjbI with pentapeptide repeats
MTRECFSRAVFAVYFYAAALSGSTRSFTGKREAMANAEQLAILKQGFEVWNKWREENPGIDVVDLSEADLTEAQLARVNLTRANLNESNLTHANLTEANLRLAFFHKADLTGADLTRADLTGAYLAGADLFGAELKGAILSDTNLRMINLTGANLTEAHLTGASLMGASLNLANLTGAHLSRADLAGADFRRANLTGADLSHANLMESSWVGTVIDNVMISGCTVHGISVWDLHGEFEEQKDLIITPRDQPTITVDDVKVAQFIYLILNNEKIRDVINTLTAKSVLILGRFGPPERKAVLDDLRNKLREYNLLPIVFDFERPDDRDYTETVQTLAALSLFVIVDVTNPKSTPLEMEATVKHFKIPFVPIIDLSADKSPFAMMVDLQKSFHWVLPTFGYHSKEELLENIDEVIINRALKKHGELKSQKATEPEILTLESLKKGKDKI